MPVQTPPILEAPAAATRQAEAAAATPADQASLGAELVPGVGTLHDVRRPKWMEKASPRPGMAMALLSAVLIAASDVLALFASATLFGWVFTGQAGDGLALGREFLPLGMAILLPLFLLQGLYSSRSITAWGSIIRAYATFLLTAYLLLTFTNQQLRSVLPVAALVLTVFGGIVISRAVMGQLVGVWTRATHVAIFGAGDHLDALRSRFATQRGVYDLRVASEERDPQRIEELVRSSGAELLGLDAFTFDRREILALQRRLEGTRTHVVALAPVGDASETAQRASEVQYVIKRVLDIGGSAVLLALTAPLMLALALAVKLTSPGPVLYRGGRMGLGGRTFDCLKFRTMYAGAELRQSELEAQNQARAPIFKIDDDPRITPLGRWLRASSLDELPQLVNVLRGEMSLVGPRPLPKRDCDLMTERDQRRHSVLPGLTGLWQVTPNRHDRENEIVQLDLQYVDNWSLASDFRILFRTIGVVARALFRGREL